jgi:hypothetical protein
MKRTKFSKLAMQLADKGAEDPNALAAWIGRKKLGKKKFQKRAARGARAAALAKMAGK